MSRNCDGKRIERCVQCKHIRGLVELRPDKDCKCDKPDEAYFVCRGGNYPVVIQTCAAQPHRSIASDCPLPKWVDELPPGPWCRSELQPTWIIDADGKMVAEIKESSWYPDAQYDAIMAHIVACVNEQAIGRALAGDSSNDDAIAVLAAEKEAKKWHDEYEGLKFRVNHALDEAEHTGVGLPRVREVVK